MEKEAPSECPESSKSRNADSIASVSAIVSDPVPENSAETDSPNAVPQLYGRRWFILLIFSSYSMTNAFQWLQYASINNVVSRFYEQPAMVVDWLSVIYMLVYIPLIFPANWILDRYGLMPVSLMGSFGNALGAWIKVASARKDLFAVTFVGQTVVAVAQIFILGIPAHLAAVWFGPKEVSKATALGVLGNLFGNALGFLLPPVFVPNPHPWDPKLVRHSLLVMYLTTACVTSLLFVLVIFVFRNSPPTPPSYAQVLKKEHGGLEYWTTIKELLVNKPFLLLLLTYGLFRSATFLGMNVGAMYAFATLLNPIILHYYPGQELNVGWIGMLFVLTGMVGAVVIGIWLDRTHLYKSTTVVVYASTFVGMGLFTFVLPFGHIWLVFIAAGLLGIFMTGYLPLGFVVAAEIHYPVCEGITSGVLNAAEYT